MSKFLFLVALIINLTITNFVHSDLPPFYEHPRFQQTLDPQIEHFDDLLSSLSPHALDYFIRLYHSKDN